MVRLEDLQVFVMAAQTGSLSGAARELDLSAAVASAALKRLEADLGTLLLLRSTRSLRLTASGERYLVHARAVLDALSAGRNALDEDRQQLCGALTLSMPSDLGRRVVLPWLSAFAAEHPCLDLQLRLSDRLSDLYRQPVDLALRYGEPADSGLVALPMVPDNPRVLCASPDYLDRHGRPHTPADLLQHNCLRMVLGDMVHSRWHFARGRQAHDIEVRGRHTSDDGDIVRRWAVAGEGIAYKSGLDVREDLAAGRLEALLPEWETEKAPLYLVCAHRPALSPAISRLAEVLRVRFAGYAAP